MDLDITPHAWAGAAAGSGNTQGLRPPHGIPSPLQKIGGPKDAEGILKAAVQDRTRNLVVDIENPKNSQEFPASVKAYEGYWL